MLPGTEHEHQFLTDSCCYACFWHDNPNRWRSIFIVCGTCGNKRCPRGTDHDWDCTGSNEYGQKGSYYSDPETETIANDGELNAFFKEHEQKKDE